MIDIYAVEEPKKLDSSGRKIVDTNADIQSDFFDTLSKMKDAMQKAQSRILNRK